MKVMEAEQVGNAIEEIRKLLYEAMEVALGIGISAEFAKDMCVSTREAESVRHGKWEECNIEDAPPFVRHRWYCSACGKWQTYGETDYCPNCGAKMDKE